MVVALRVPVFESPGIIMLSPLKLLIFIDAIESTAQVAVTAGRV
jgi:hypothetical protein